MIIHIFLCMVMYMCMSVIIEYIKISNRVTNKMTELTEKSISNEKKNLPDTTNCTSIGELRRLILPEFPVPKHLKIAIKNNLNITDSDKERTRSYVEFLKNLPKIKTVQKEHYLFLFKILLYTEDYTGYLEMRRHNLQKSTITKISSTAFKINVPTLNINDPFIKVEDLVKIMANRDTTEKGFQCIASITTINNKDIIISVPKKFAMKYNKNQRFDIEFIYSDFSMKCCHYALYLINHYDLLATMYPVIRINTKKLNLNLCWFNKSIKKNAEQKQAIENILNMTAYPAPYILFGPPGTGKTATLVELICQIYQQPSSKKVLVCGSSNTAVDEITSRLLKYIPSNEIYRMYSRSKHRKEVPQAIHPCANFVEDTSIFLPKDVLLYKRIVLVTLITSTRLLQAELWENYFSYVIIDEASQAIEPETIIPFLLACTKNEEKPNSLQAQVILAGDPYQLGPVVRSKIAQPLLGISMLERLLNHPAYKPREGNKYDPHYVTKLIRNYRSHKHILNVPNKMFYDNELLPLGGIETTAAIGWSFLPNKKFPLIFHAANGTEKKPENSFSIYNSEEISITMKYIELLLGKNLGTFKVKQQNIGIVTPFKEQKIRLTKKLNNKGWKDIAVGTVEVFQGQEKEIIIVSTVRSRLFAHDGIRHIGCLSNPKRFNVAITRAKFLLIVIGNPVVLKTDNCWRELMRYCKDNKAYLKDSSAFAQMFKEQVLCDKLENGCFPKLHKRVNYPAFICNNLSKR